MSYKVLKNTDEYIPIGVSQIIKGVETNEKEIVFDENTQLNYERNKIVGATYYDISKKHFKNCFMLVLETGGRKWYPGSKKVGTVSYPTVMWDDYDVDNTLRQEICTIAVSEQIEILSNITQDNVSFQWYEIKYNDKIGYISQSNISNIRYVDRT